MNVSYAMARRYQSILSVVPEARQNQVNNSLVYYGGTINAIVFQMFETYNRTVQKTLIKQTSEYIDPVENISLYARYGVAEYGRFGHDYMCISNISFPEFMQRRGMFTALVYALIAECK